jgi:hypothetical protein
MFSAFFASILYLTANFVLAKYSLFIKGKFSLGAVVGTSLLLALSLDLQANSENPPNNKVSLPLSNAPSIIKINKGFETRAIEAEALIYRTSERIDAKQAKSRAYSRMKCFLRSIMTRALIITGFIIRLKIPLQIHKKSS